jgi:hypothetical protein
LVIVFQDRAECEAFAAATKMPTDERYLNGRALASNLGIELQTTPTDPARKTEALA